MAEWFDKIPEDVEAEKSLLATCSGSGASDNAFEVISELSEEDFVSPKNRVIFKALRTLLSTRTEVSIITLKDVIEQSGELNQVEGLPGLADVLGTYEVGDALGLADLLRRKTKLRKLIKISASMGKQAAVEAQHPEVIIEEVAGLLYKLKDSTDLKRKGLLNNQPISDIAMHEIEQRRLGKGSLGVKVGIPSFDALTVGLRPGNLMVLAARPGVGKSTLGLNMLYRAALAGTRGAFFSLEMSHEEVFMKLLSSQAKIDSQKFMTGKVSDLELDELYKAKDKIVDLPIYVCDQAAITVPQIEAMIRKHQSSSNDTIDFIVVDYLQLISSPESSRGRTQNEAIRIAEISRGLKLLAKEYRIPIIVISQLNRLVEQRVGKRPQLSDLRDSGAIEQDADIVAFLHQQDSTDIGSKQAMPTTLIVAKHRNGPTGDIQLAFKKDHSSYYELERSVGIGSPQGLDGI